jgi:hypothetical protein
MTLMGNSVGNVSGDDALGVGVEPGDADGGFMIDSDIRVVLEIQVHQMPDWSAL